MTDKHAPLSFKVECSACYGMNVWTLGRITRLLTAMGKLPPECATNMEVIAQQFILNSKRILCPDCNKSGVLTVQRIVPET